VSLERRESLSKVVSIYGTASCPKCGSTKRKVNHLLEKRSLSAGVDVLFHDMNTPDGMAEAMFVDVQEADIPTTIVSVDGNSNGRWSAMVPRSADILGALGEGV